MPPACAEAAVATERALRHEGNPFVFQDGEASVFANLPISNLKSPLARPEPLVATSVGALLAAPVWLRWPDARPCLCPALVPSIFCIVIPSEAAFQPTRNLLLPISNFESEISTRTPEPCAKNPLQ